MKLYIYQDPNQALEPFQNGLSHVHNINLPTWCPDWQLARKTEPFSKPDGFRA
jgi:hypothetical protein